MEQILEEAKPNSELHSRIYVHWKTGLRRGEFNDSYLENGFVKTTDPIKQGKERSIPIDEETEKHYRIAKEGKYRDDTISSKFKEILVKLDLYETRHGDTRHFHNLRHTFAVRKYYETRDIYRVKTLLGHSSVKTTEKYAQFDISQLGQDFNIENSEDNQPRSHDTPSNSKKTRNKANKNGRNIERPLNGVAYV